MGLRLLLLLDQEANFFGGDYGSDCEASLEFVQLGREYVVGGKRCVEGSDFVKDKISEVAEGEDGLCVTVAEEEGDTDALDEEVERFIHVVGEGDGYFVVWSNRREVWDVMESPRAIEI
jgi:hypothetical protein